MKKETTLIRIDSDVKERLQKDQEHFSKTIGMNFSLSDTLREYQKILNLVKYKHTLEIKK